MNLKKISILAIFALSIMLLMVFISPAGAITDGDKDGDDHPQVVLLLMEVGGAPAFRCSGTLLSPTVLLTAGHCTNNFPDAPYTGMRVFTESVVDGGDNNYPFAGPNSVEAASWAAHTDYETAPFFVNDVGVVILEEPGVVLIDVDDYATLPKADAYDEFKTRRGRNRMTFTSVGYGGQQSSPVPFHNQFDRVRYVAYPHLIQINTPGFTGDFSLLLSNNHSTGGTCFGDSGGPNFLSDTNEVAGITSYGLNGNCAGTGGVFRTDRQNVLDFINSFMD